MTGGLVVYVCWEDYLGAAPDVLCPEAALIGLTVAYTVPLDREEKAADSSGEREGEGQGKKRGVGNNNKDRG
jgi:hypothetical protein